MRPAVPIAVLVAALALAGCRSSAPSSPLDAAAVNSVAANACGSEYPGGGSSGPALLDACVDGFVAGVATVASGGEVDDPTLTKARSEARSRALSASGGAPLDDDWPIAFDIGFIAGSSWFEEGAKTDTGTCPSGQQWRVDRQACVYST